MIEYMKRGNVLCVICWMACCMVVTGVYGQGDKKQPLNFGEFFHEKMERIAGVLPVYRDSAKVYLEIPENLLGREIEIRAQLNKGFDMVARPVESLGVVYLQKAENGVVYWQRRIFAERVSDEKSELLDAFQKSNMQPIDIMYPIEAYTADRKGYIIDITEILRTGDEWFNISFVKLRGQKSSLAKIIGVHPFEQGVSFTLRRMYGFVPEQVITGSMSLSPTVYLPAEIGCVITLLPERGMRERFSDKRIGFRSITFLDYTQSPYSVVRDSIIQKWNLQVSGKDRRNYRKGKLVEPKNPIVFYVDSCCPREFIPYIREGVLAWNTAFEKAGFKNALRVKVADRTIVSVEQPAVIAYDLGEAGIETKYTCHPKTGEILSCRINIGHGFLAKELARYFFQCGMADARIRKNRFDDRVAGEILRGQVMKAVGYALGLKPNPAGSTAFTIEQVKNATWVKENGYTGSVMDMNPYHYAAQEGDKLPVKELIPRIGGYDHQAIGWGYREFPGNKNSYEDRESLREKYSRPEFLFLTGEDFRASSGDLSANPLKALKCALENMHTLYGSLDDMIYPDKKYDSGKAITDMNAAGMELYGEYLLQIASCIGNKRGNTPVSAEEQHEAMELLNQYLFTGENHFYSRLMKESMWGRPREVFMRQAKKVFQKLLSPEVIKDVVDTEREYAGNVYTAEMYFGDLFSMLFGNFDVTRDISYAQMDMQILCVNALLASAEKLETQEESYAFIVKQALRELAEGLNVLKDKHTDKSVRTMSGLLVSRVEKKFNK